MLDNTSHTCLVEIGEINPNKQSSVHIHLVASKLRDMLCIEQEVIVKVTTPQCTTHNTYYTEIYTWLSRVGGQNNTNQPLCHGFSYCVVQSVTVG